MPDYTKHYQHIQRIVSLAISPDLPDAVTAVGLLRFDSWSAAEVPLPAAAVAALHPVPSDAPSFAGGVREIIRLAMEAEDPPSLGRLQELVERRWEERHARRTAPEPGSRARVVRDAMPNAEPAHAATWAVLRRHLEVSHDEAVAREAELVERSHEAAEAFRTGRRDVEAQLASYRRASLPTAAPSAWQNALRAGGAWWAVPALLMMLLYLIGQPAPQALASGVVTAVLVGLWAAYSKPVDPGATPLARISARICAPAAEALAQWSELREQVAEATAVVAHCAELRTALAAELASAVAVCGNREKIREALRKRVERLPEGPLEEVRPGLVQITGREVARRLAEKLSGTTGRGLEVSHVPARELAGDEVTTAAEAILSAVGQGRPEVTLHAAVAAVEALEDGRMLLAEHLRMLANTATSAARLKPGARLDRTICPEMLSVGLPGGMADPLVEFANRAFPQAPIMASFRPQRMEILYDIANVSREQLRITQMAEQAYSKSSALERRLWHLPRRYRGAREGAGGERRAV